jgi:peroxiredoxin Q/BCP
VATKKTRKPAKKVAPKKAAKKASKKSAAKKTPPKKAAKKATKQPAAKRAVAKKAPTKKGPAEKAAKKVTPKPASGDDLIGKAAPTFSLSDQDGAVVSSGSLAKRPYVLYFYPKDDTPGCTKEACDFRDGFGKFAREGVRVLGVSPDSVASHGRFRDKYSLPFTLLSDTDKQLVNAYGVWVKKQNYGREYMGVLRSTFLVDGKGVVRHAWRGVKVDGHADAVLAKVRELG